MSSVLTIIASFDLKKTVSVADSAFCTVYVVSLHMYVDCCIDKLSFCMHLSVQEEICLVNITYF